MSTTAIHPLAADYLRRLRHAGRGLPRARLDDLCAEIESYLVQAVAPGATDADALTVLERLGSPEEIIAAEEPEPTPEVAPRNDPRGAREWAAIILLPLGGFAFGIGWLVGLVMLWSSRAWSTRDKIIGTLILPGGVAVFLPLGLLFASPTLHRCRTDIGGQRGLPFTRCTVTAAPGPHHTALGVIVLVIAVVAPVVTAAYLAWRARRPAL